MAKTPGKHYDSYDAVLSHLYEANRPKHLLLGNGFSRAYNDKIFSYTSLSDYAKNGGNDSVKHLFDVTKTSNFEEAIHAVDVSVDIIEGIETTDKELIKRLRDLSEAAKCSLIEAITELHPEYVFKLKEHEIKKCGTFLSPYVCKDCDSSIISTNYDLLLYWVLMRFGDENSEVDCCDGFSYDVDDYDSNYEFDKNEHSLIWTSCSFQNVYYLHGALHLFSSIEGVMKEQYRESAEKPLILDRIKERIYRRQYPLFVTEGDGDAKKRQISKSAYLSNCFNHLKTLNGSLVTFGFSFGDSDQHVIDAINKAASKRSDHRLRSIYIGVFSDKDRKHIEEISNKFKVKVNTFDAKTVNVWRDPDEIQLD